jgi:hypothetical protein
VPKSTLIAAVCAASVLLVSDALARPARCVLTGSVAYKGKCDFLPDPGNGGFAISPIRPKSFPAGVDPISVYKIDKDTADVRGLTRLGINSRWGEAKRSKKDPACWEGSDFRICVY